ncbi:MAG: hypothetical protein KJT03_21620 [Verrucomicrobiae bacterium]|nr:hypothetical protein [Verrucomicrobiae bacterium]
MGSDEYQGLTLSATSAFPRLCSPSVDFIHFDHTCQSIASWSHHGPTQLMQPGPLGYASMLPHTTYSGYWSKKNILFEKIRARDVWHLTSRIARKTLVHALGILINRQTGRSDLQFKGLID